MAPAAGPLAGTVRVPGDKSIGHRALILGALGEGESRVTGLSDGADNASTRGALEALAVGIARDGADFIVQGVGLEGLRAPEGPVDCGNSGTTVRLLAGACAGRGFPVTFDGDASLRARPMGRIAEPLSRMGASVTGRHVGDRLCLPLTVGGDGLRGIDYALPVASAQVKSCLLLAGLRAQGTTRLTEPAASRDHTERMLFAAGVPLSRHGLTVAVDGPVAGLSPAPWRVPGDPSSAAFLVVAALLVPGSEVRVKGVCLNPTRIGFVPVLRRMGAMVEVEDAREVGGEPVGTLVARHGGALRATEVGGAEVPALVDEVPILAAAAALAEGDTVFRDAGELRVKESDRIAATCALLAAFGVETEERPDGFVVRGRPGGVGGGGTANPRGDHRLAMTAAILGLAGGGVTVVRPECIDVSFPGFDHVLNALGADVTAVT